MPLPMPRSASTFDFVQFILRVQPVRFALLSLLAAAVPGGAGHAFAQGLPAGGGLDPQRVTELRYGAAPAPAPTPTPASPLPVANGERQTPARADARLAAPAAPAAPAAATPAQPRIDGALATLSLERTGQTQAGDRAPLTFGQAFGPGELARETRLVARLANGEQVALQVDAKAFHDDGSVRHAVISGILPTPGAGPLAFGLVKGESRGRAEPGAAAPVNASPAALVRTGLTANVKLTVGEKQYTASLERLLAQGKPASWLNGPIAYEWHVDAPLADRNGSEHPHLAARFAVRWYPASKKARVDVTVENNWAYEPAPQNFIYDAEIEVGGQTVYRKANLTHYHHARWRTLAWWGGDPALHLRHDARQLMASRALPNYDPTVQIRESALARDSAKWTGPVTEPMGVGLAMRAMPTTGGRGDIGLQPGWAVAYLLSMDQRAKLVTMGTADLAGSWSMHYRDRRTGLPVSLLDYPYMTILGNRLDTRNSATGKFEAFPKCAAADACRTPNRHDIDHQPNLAYLPYLVSGDHYYLEELQFWAMYDVFASNPGYRDNRKGLLKAHQVRGQAWALRTLAEAAYITPDGHRLKDHFLKILDSNLDWYNREYSRNPNANALGFIANGYAVVYLGKTGIAPWQDDFFTSAVGRAAELGFAKAGSLLAWKARFPVSRMTGEGACWVNAAMYAMRVRDSASSPFYATIGESFRKSQKEEVAGLECGSAQMAGAMKLRPGEMNGHASSPTGFPSNMQPALAYAADALGEPGRKAWDRFMARSVKPDYGTAAQFAIVPRGR